MSARIYNLAYRRARYAVERSAHLRLQRPAITPPRRVATTGHDRDRAPSRTELVALTVAWLILLTAGIWLARYDPHTLSQLMSHALSEAPHDHALPRRRQRELLTEDPDTPAPATIARYRETFADLIQHTTTEPTE